MEEFGRFLKEERMARGISLSAIQVTTRIRTSYLEAIEAGDFASLPGNTYARAFLKLYAKSIGLDPEEVVERYDALQGETAVEVEEFQPPARERLARRRRKRRMKTLRWAGLLVVLAALIVFGREWIFSPESDLISDDLQVGFLVDNQPDPGQDVPATVSGMSDEDPLEDSSFGENPVGEGALPNDSLDTDPAGDDQSSTDLSSDESDTIDGQLVTQIGDQAEEDSFSGNIDGEAVPVWNPSEDDSDIQVTLTFEGLSWSGVWVDGERVVYEEVAAGTVLSWTGQESIRVRFGRGDVVRIELNGEDLGPAGNGVVDREFTMESVMALRRQED